MKAACDYFRGFHNFSSFADRRRDAEASTMVQVEEVSLDQWEVITIIRIKASHFLWRMARRMVGVIVEVGRGRLPLAAVPDMLAGISDLPARLTAPASGLFLEGIYYSGHMALPPASPVFPFSFRAGCSWLSRE
jgi:tRNA pseudouridine38-40 synthase